MEQIERRRMGKREEVGYGRKGAKRRKRDKSTLSTVLSLESSIFVNILYLRSIDGQMGPGLGSLRHDPLGIGMA